MVLLSLAWIATTLFAAYVSVQHELPYDLAFLDGSGAKESVGDDWLWGWGTALAVPLPVVAVVALLSVVVSYGWGATRASSLLLVLAGAGSVAFTFLNDITDDRLRRVHVEPLESGVIIAVVSLSGLLVIFGLLTFGTTPKRSRTHY
jgi:hypothetical protein